MWSPVSRDNAYSFSFHLHEIDLTRLAVDVYFYIARVAVEAEFLIISGPGWSFPELAITKQPRSSILEAGRPSLLDCAWRAERRPSVTWTRDGVCDNNDNNDDDNNDDNV